MVQPFTAEMDSNMFWEHAADMLKRSRQAGHLTTGGAARLRLTNGLAT